MKNHWRISTKIILSFFLLAGGQNVFADKNNPHVRHAELDSLDVDELILSVDVSDVTEKVVQKQLSEGGKINKVLKPKGGKVETYNNKQVLIATIPAKLLFDPNSTELSKKASEFLKPFKTLLQKEPDYYRMVLIMHTDNTGSPFYREELTRKRADAVFDWFEKEGVDTSFIFPKYMADDEKLYENDSRQNREANRRLEIYLIPGPKMIDELKKSSKK